MIGKKFGRLLVTRLSENTSGKRKRLMYYCDCDCGSKDVEIVGEKLRNGHTKSCGCLLREVLIQRNKKYNEFDLSGEYGIGWTTNTNEEFWFDLEDYDKIKDYCWYKLKNGYIGSTINDKCIYLHRLVMGSKKDEVIDHKEHKLYDNRKCMLRIGSQSNNLMNLSKRKDNTSGITGVWYNAQNNNWCAEIMVNKQKIRLGSYVKKEDAETARKEAEEKYFGEWSYDNSMNNNKDNMYKGKIVDADL